MNFAELPEISPIWTDFLRARLPLLPGPLEMHNIRAIADRALQTGMRNSQPNAAIRPVAVVVNFYASLFGGPLSQILKCLTGIKICERLRNQGISACCLCRVVEPHSSLNAHTLLLLDGESELRRFSLTGQEREQLLQTGILPVSRSADILAEIRQTGSDRFDKETLELLDDSFGAQECLTTANARWIASLFREWDLSVVDSASPEQQSAREKALAVLLPEQERMRSLMQKQCAVLAGGGYAVNMPREAIPSCLILSRMEPTAVFVADPLELADFVMTAPVYEAFDQAQPLVWPRCSATIVNVRNRKTLERYQIKPEQFFGREHVEDICAGRSIHHDAVTTLQKLHRTAQEYLTDDGSMDSLDKKYVKIHEKCRRKILYQLEKLQLHCAESVAVREQTALRKIRRARNWIAPEGELQENGLAGIFLPLCYSRAGIHALYEKLDIGTLEHQIIDLD